MAEKDCGQIHVDIEEAIRHARQDLRCVDSEPYWGKKTGAMSNFGNVIGYQTSDGLKRWRLDYDPVKGAHVNEEDHSVRPSRKVVHRIASHFTKDYLVTLFWQKWTRRYDKPQWAL